VAHLRDDFDALFANFDAVLTPVTAGTAPPIETTGDPSFCTLWTLLGLPSISLPLMAGPDGLPLGVQLVGRRAGDAPLLRTARWLVDQVQAP
jgi:Asp-tRNA(Asn)/Glu-tRNA(Gln) amidotransferase A subunit family amidase